MAKRAKTAIVSLKVRVREHLRAKLEKSARTQGGSLNSEIVRRLERSFEEDTLAEDLVKAARTLPWDAPLESREGDSFFIGADGEMRVDGKTFAQIIAEMEVHAAILKKLHARVQIASASEAEKP